MHLRTRQHSHGIYCMESYDAVYSVNEQQLCQSGEICLYIYAGYMETWLLGF